MWRRKPKKNFFSLTLKSDYLEIGLYSWKSTLILEVSGAVLMVLENPREILIFILGRTHNRSRSPR